MELKKAGNNILLQNKDEKIVLETIKKLRHDGKDADLFDLADLYKNTEVIEIKNEINSFFCDLSNQNSSASVVRLIQTTHHKPTLKMLASSCWQSRLNYIENFELFIDLVIHEPFEIAFEAFTVIESFEEPTSERRISALIDYVKNNIKKCKEENLVLAHDLVKIIEGFKI